MHIYADMYIDMSVSMWSKSGRVFSPTVTLLVFTITAFMCVMESTCVLDKWRANFHLMVNWDFFFKLKNNHGGIMSNFFLLILNNISTNIKNKAHRDVQI